MFSLGNTSYNSYIASSVSGQITNMIGGIAAAIYDGNYQMGAYGASQVLQYNDSAGLKKKQNPDGPWSVYDLSNGNDPYLVATSDRPDLSGKLTFVYSRFTDSGTFWDGETLGDFVQQIRDEGSFSQLANVDIPSFDGSTISTQGQSEIVPGDWGDLIKYHSQLGFSVGSSGLRNRIHCAGRICLHPIYRRCGNQAIWTKFRERSDVWRSLGNCGRSGGRLAETSYSPAARAAETQAFSPEVSNLGTNLIEDSVPATSSLSVDNLSLDASDAAVGPEKIFLSLDTADTWGNPATLEQHFLHHGADFGATNVDEYAKMASDFFQSAIQNDLPIKINTDGTIRIYDPETNAFGSFNPDGNDKDIL